jgi:hypothetical protein
MKKIQSFKFEGKQYDINLWKTADKKFLRVFRNGKPANRFRYVADRITEADFRNKHGRTFMKEPIASAKADIFERREEEARKLGI